MSVTPISNYIICQQSVCVTPISNHTILVRGVTVTIISNYITFTSPEAVHPPLLKNIPTLFDTIVEFLNSSKEQHSIETEVLPTDITYL